MITCEKCRAEFMADRYIGYPGHCDPPNSLLAYAILFGVAAVIFGIISIFAARMIMVGCAAAFLAGALLSLLHIPEARRLCDESGGGICPSCGHKNEVKWYS